DTLCYHGRRGTEAMPTRAPRRQPRRQIDVRVFPAFRQQVKAAWVRRVADAALAVGDPQGAAGVSVVIADDETLRDLNARFRGFDYVTDVLSFGATGELLDPDAPPPEPSPEFPEISGITPMLGEVVLSYPLAERQADEHNVAVEREVALLVVHGVLHLLGHDHAKQDEEATMKGLEAQALALVFSGFEGAART
ncbi:MAG: rRNA maturation RNase YbeY, partial [Dehalococcoidia bacterium]